MMPFKYLLKDLHTIYKRNKKKTELPKENEKTYLTLPPLGHIGGDILPKVIDCLSHFDDFLSIVNSGS